jgi:hypothetical protein
LNFATGGAASIFTAWLVSFEPASLMTVSVTVYVPAAA